LTGSVYELNKKKREEASNQTGRLTAGDSVMKFESGMISLIVMAGFLIVTPYAIYGGSVKSYDGFNRETVAAAGSGAFSGAAAGGPQSSEDEAPDCRSCAKGQP
jgi:hypothetical protein